MSMKGCLVLLLVCTFAVNATEKFSSLHEFCFKRMCNTFPCANYKTKKLMAICVRCKIICKEDGISANGFSDRGASVPRVIESSMNGKRPILGYEDRCLRRFCNKTKECSEYKKPRAREVCFGCINYCKVQKIGIFENNDVGTD